VLTAPLVDRCSSRIPRRPGTRFRRTQGQVKRQRRRRRKFNDENRVREERELIDSSARAGHRDHGARRGRVQEDRAGRVPEVRVRGKVAARTSSSASMRSGRDRHVFPENVVLSPVFGRWADLTARVIFAVLFLALVLQVVRPLVFGATGRGPRSSPRSPSSGDFLGGADCVAVPLSATWPWTSSCRASRPLQRTLYRWALPRSASFLWALPGIADYRVS